MRSLIVKTMAAILAAAFLPQTTIADESVRQVQQMLTVLGHNVGGADGILGRRTETALSEALSDFGLTYDGMVSENELAFLARLAPTKLRIDFGVAVSETYFLDSADINGDGRLDFVVTAMADPSAQIGIECCEVPADRVAEVKAVVPALVYSTPEGFAVQPFPASGASNRAFAGKFLTNPTGTFFVLGRNGEMGLPGQNHGEKSIIFRMSGTAAGVTIEQAAEFPHPTATASVDVWDLDGDDYPEIFEDNYGQVRARPGDSDSTIVRFAVDGVVKPSDVTIDLEEQKAHNSIRLMDIDGNGVADLLAAGEVWKSDAGETRSRRPGSYLMLNQWDVPRGKAERIYLDPPHFGADHAAFSLLPLPVDGRLFVFESAMRFRGFQSGGFDGFNLDVFEYSPESSTVTLANDEVLPKAPAGETAITNYLRRADLDFDGIDEVYLDHYKRQPEYLDWDGKTFALTAFPVKDFATHDWQSNQAYLPDAVLKCARTLTFPGWIGDGGTRMDVRMSSCLRLEE